MPVWKWRRRPTRNFGNVWVPFAQIAIQTTEGRFQSFALQVDSGAMVSLLRRSVADLLRIQLEQGREIHLSGVGGAHTTAFVHDLNIRFDSDIALGPTPFAIAATESVPNLLGRLGVFDRLQVDFDASLTETRITAPWLNTTDRRIWEFCIDIENHILRRWDEVTLAPQCKNVVAKFLNRAGQLTATAAGMVKLHRDTEALLFVRAFFELSAQFEYLMGDPEERSKQFEEYGKITKRHRMRDMLNNTTGFIGRYLAESPLRKEGEARVEREYQEARSQFLTKKGKEWKNWYGRTFRNLVSTLSENSPYDWKTEYAIWYRQGSAWIHFDPSALALLQTAPETFGNRNLLASCFHYYFRMLLLVSKDLILTAEQYEVLLAYAEDRT